MNLKTNQKIKVNIGSLKEDNEEFVRNNNIKISTHLKVKNNLFTK